MRGFCAIGLVSPKNERNVGGALRAAGCYGASFVAMRRRMSRTGEDVHRYWRHHPVLVCDDLRTLVPYDCVPVAIEILEGAQSLVDYKHPERAFYLFGPEDGSVPRDVLSWCRDVVRVPTTACMNLAATVNVVLYDRMAKATRP